MEAIFGFIYKVVGRSVVYYSLLLAGKKYRAKRYMTKSYGCFTFLVGFVVTIAVIFGLVYIIYC